MFHSLEGIACRDLGKLVVYIAEEMGKVNIACSGWNGPALRLSSRLDGST